MLTTYCINHKIPIFYELLCKSTLKLRKIFAYSKKHVICTAHSKKHSKSRQKKGARKAAKKGGKKGNKKDGKKDGKKGNKKDGKKVGKKYAMANPQKKTLL